MMTNFVSILSQLDEVGELSFNVRKKGYQKMNEEEFNQCVQILEQAGATPKYELSKMCEGEYYQSWKVSEHEVTLHLKKDKTKEEKIAELQAKIDELHKGGE
jgi:hypothetical protein